MSNSLMLLKANLSAFEASNIFETKLLIVKKNYYNKTNIHYSFNFLKVNFQKIFLILLNHTHSQCA